MYYKYDDKSYWRYRKYIDNRQRFKTEKISMPIFMLLLIGICCKVWKWIALLTVAIIITKVADMVQALMKKSKSEKVTTEKTVLKENDFLEVKECRKNLVIQLEKIKERKEQENMKKAKTNSTEAGYLNKNNQRNNGRTELPGTGLNQWFYSMECMNCGHKYYANGHDIWLRKCPKCQGGRP